jgi:DNA-binding CsgD family transcriptional regulator/PAS domain-containing protein
MPSDEAELLRLVILAHESASDPGIWPRFLEEYARTIDAGVVLLQRHYFSERRSQAIETYGMVNAFTDSYNTYYSKLNVWRDQSASSYVKGRTVLDQLQYPRALLKRTEFYNDHLLPNRATHSMGGVIERQGGTALVLTALRDEPQGSFGAEHSRLAESLLPHLSRAFITQERLHALEGGERALNALSLGVVLLASDSSVVFSNRAADDLLRSGDGLALRNGRLVTSSSNTDSSLRRMLQYAVAGADGVECPSDVLVMRPSGRRPFHVIASPLRRRPGPFAGIAAPVALVVIRDPERQRPVGLDALKQGYALTLREAELALSLSDGETLQRTADRLGMTYETARTHLRHILSKTGTSRQAELTALLQRMSAHLTDDDQR